MQLCPSCGNDTFVWQKEFTMNEDGTMHKEIETEDTTIRCGKCLSPVKFTDGRLILFGRGL